MINQKNRDTIETMVAWILLNLKKANQNTTREIEQLLENAYKEEENLDRALMYLLFALQTALKKDLLNNLEIPSDFRQILSNRTRVKLNKLADREQRLLERKLKKLISSNHTAKKISQSGGGVLELIGTNIGIGIASGVGLLIISTIIFLLTRKGTRTVPYGPYGPISTTPPLEGYFDPVLESPVPRSNYVQMPNTPRYANIPEPPRNHQRIPQPPPTQHHQRLPPPPPTQHHQRLPLPPPTRHHQQLPPIQPDFPLTRSKHHQPIPVFALQ